ncbi:TIM-barrel domain-containing protein [Algibacter amylolyticus]|nr:TIM-barrel domain-containing protein [Algibacter amylolyticus]MBB5268742.1 alpha-glucosidase (family GH31 glycosyl hydrolase) [Algibacter amylolyticus]
MKTIFRFSKHLILTVFSILFTCVVSAQNSNPNDLQQDYADIEAFRISKGDNPSYGGGSEDAIIKKWVNFLWDEGWNRKSSWDIDFKTARKDLLGTNNGKKTNALRVVNEFTNLVYADGSVGNVRNNSWVLKNNLSQLVFENNKVNLKFENANGDNYLLNISFFNDGLIHVTGEELGYFDDKALIPAAVSASETNGKLVITYLSEPILIEFETAPFSMKVYRNGALKFSQKGFNVSESIDNPRGVRVRFDAAQEDEYIGFGERFDRLKHKKSIFSQWCIGMAEALNSGTPETYKPIPFYLNPVNSTGMFYNHGGLVRWDIEAGESGVVDISSIGGLCDYFLFVGDNAYDIYRAYTNVTGRIFEVKDWVHMPWMGHHFGNPLEFNSKPDRLIGEVRGYNENGFTYSAMYAPGISPGSNETLDIYKNEMEPLGVRFGAHLDPMVKNGNINQVILRSDGTPWVSDHAFQSGNNYYDYSLESVINKEFNGSLYKISMLDFGEQAGWDTALRGYPTFSGLESHNLYQHLYHRAAYISEMKKYPDGDWMNFARSGWAGDHAIGGFFAGDTTSSLKDLVSTIRAGINLCASAGVYWGADIGAYKRNPALTKLNYLRWAQFGLFSPLMRTHAHQDKELRPWKYDAETNDAFKAYTWLRASLVPYIHESGLVATSDGIPIMRALPIEFPKDVNAYLDYEYMFGPSLLVAPYVTTNHSRGNVYLPKGTWFNFFTKEKHTGEKTFSQTSPDFTEMPVYVRAPAILPIRIGDNSPVLGKSYFASTGTDLYNAKSVIDAFQIYPLNGAAESVFSYAAVSYENKSSVVTLHINSESLFNKQVHIEVVDVSTVTEVIAGTKTLSSSSSWEDMMVETGRYYYDQASKVLFVNYLNDTALNVPEVRESNTFEIYPNPSSDSLSVKLNATQKGKVQMKIYNTTGALVKSFNYGVNEFSNIEEISLRGLALGLYVLSIEQEGKKHVLKFIKKD